MIIERAPRPWDPAPRALGCRYVRDGGHTRGGFGGHAAPGGGDGGRPDRDRTTEFERGMPPPHQAWTGSEWVHDPLVIDDQALIVNVRDRGLVVLTGCGTRARSTSSGTRSG